MNPGSLTTPSHILRVLDGLVQSERASAAAYGAAIRLFPDTSIAAEWKLLREIHLENIDRLQDLIFRQGGGRKGRAGQAGPPDGIKRWHPDSAASAMGVLVKHVETTLNSYEEALADPGVPPSLKQIFRSELLPPLQFHQITLDRISRADS